MSEVWTSTRQDVAGIQSYLSMAGQGAPVLVLHHDIGTVDRLTFYDRLAERFQVLIPDHPGWGRSERPEWMRHPRDIAAIYAWMLADLGLSRVSLVGLGFGGWIAAEMASMVPTAYEKLILVGAMGIKPPEGEIADQSIVSYIDYPRAGFHNPTAFSEIYGEVSTDQLEAWDIAREMSFRIAWKPYMYSQTLPHLLGGVRTPTLIVWGDDDRHVPLSAGEAYAKALPLSRLTVLPECGHFAEMEKPQELAALAIDFLED